MKPTSNRAKRKMWLMVVIANKVPANRRIVVPPALAAAVNLDQHAKAGFDANFGFYLAHAWDTIARLILRYHRAAYALLW